MICLRKLGKKYLGVVAGLGYGVRSSEVIGTGFAPLVNVFGSVAEMIISYTERICIVCIGRLILLGIGRVLLVVGQRLGFSLPYRFQRIWLLVLLRSLPMLFVLGFGKRLVDLRCFCISLVVA